MLKSNAMRFILLFVIGILLSSCESGTPIKNILDNPRDYSGKVLQVKGQVSDIFSLIVIKYFTLKDGTGEITVITDKPLPKKGTTIKVKGKVQEAFSLGDQQLIVIMESDN
jgi:hypothetical protein